MLRPHLLAALVLLPALATPAGAQEAPLGGHPAPRAMDAWDLSGYVATESRAFFSGPAVAGQATGHGASFVAEPELHREWSDGDASLTFKPFLRLDSVDSERTHFDVRELAWVRAAPRWELTAGISRVFWGVTESHHLVDIVNQTDLVESPDFEDKLGQPMLRLTTINPWGLLELFVMTGFRERTFPGFEGRLRPALPIDTDRAIYESSAERWHTDWAIRWSHAVGAFDLGLSHFSGTSREPLLQPDLEATEPSLLPYYPLVDQTGLDAQATLGSWLLKLEAIWRNGFEVEGSASPLGDYAATTYGFEYTFWSFFGSSLDVGAIAEHLWDERGELATSPFQNDLFTGTRLAFNDTQSTEIVAGVIHDLDNQASLYSIEASRRVGGQWILELELRGFSGQRPLDPLAALRTDDYAQLSVQRHF